MGGCIQHIHDSLFPGDGSEYDRHIVERSYPAAQSVFIFLHGVAVLEEEVPFVDHKHAGLPVADDEIEYAHVLGFHSGVGVNHQDADIGLLDGSDGAHHGVEFKILADSALLAHSGRVHKHELVVELVVVGRDGVPGRAGDRGYDVPFFSEQGICQGRFADVRLSDDGDVRQVGPVVIFLSGLFREHSDHFVEEIACAASVGGGDAPDLSESERIELVGVKDLLPGVHLVDAEDYRFAAAPQQVRDLCIIVRDACGRFHHEEHHIGLLDGNDHLPAYCLLEHIVRVGCPSSGVDHRKLSSAPFAFSVVAVSGHTCCLIDDCLTHADEAVE